MRSTMELEGEGIITTDEIKLILDRYRIGKKPLAKLLGWGETTIIRYMEGDIPTKEYSNRLRAILDEPEGYYDLLCRRKDCLTGVAYKKSKHAVIMRIMSSKIYASAYYIVDQCNAEVSPACLQFLLYYAQAFSLALYDRELFQEECAVGNGLMPYGKLYDSMKCCGIHAIECGEGFLTREESDLIDAVIDAFTWYGPKALEAMTADEKSMMKLSRDKLGNRIIAKDTLKAYFRKILEHYRINSLEEIGRYPDMRFMELKEMDY